MEPTPSTPTQEPVPTPEVTPEVTPQATPAPEATPAPAVPAEPATEAAQPAVTPVESTPPAPIVGGSDGAVVASDVVSGAPAKKKFPLKPVLIGLAAVLVIGAGSAAAYVGVVLPNKPENVVLASIANGLKEKQSNFVANLEGSSGGVAGKLTLTGSTDATTKTFASTVSASVSGVTLGGEVRYVDSNAYLKLTNLTSAAALLKVYSPDLAPVADKLAGQLNDKWIVFDSTLIKEAKLDCALNSGWTLSDSDAKQLEDAYMKNKFLTVTSSAADTVNGAKVTKYEVSIDDDTAAAFGNSLKNLSVYKQLNACDSSASKAAPSTLNGDHKKTPLTVWANKSKKELVKIAYKNKDVTTDVTIDHTKKATVTAPTGAVPAMQVLAQVEAMFGGSMGATGL